VEEGGRFSVVGGSILVSPDSPQVTDAWLDRMAAMKSLRHVMIGGAQVSDEAIARLHRSLTEVQIYVDGRPK
jgi:non-ribosomal peptide synthetase component E (peptide arylation enzyme)